MSADTAEPVSGQVGRCSPALAAATRAAAAGADCRFTENAQALPWFRRGFGDRHRSRDAAAGLPRSGEQSAGFFALYEHGSRPVSASGSTADGIARRDDAPVRRPDLRPGRHEAAGPGFGDVDPAGRASRAELVAAANAYFDGIEQDDGGIIPARAECVRVENGVRTVLADASTFGSSTADQGLNLFTMGVREQIDTGFFAYIPRIRSRRFPVIDEVQSVVMAGVVFDQPGTMTQVTLKDGREIVLPTMFGRPGSVLVLEAFQVESGRIRAINAVLDFCQYGIQPGWLL